jgi:hypothetical protein
LTDPPCLWPDPPWPASSHAGSGRARRRRGEREGGGVSVRERSVGDRGEIEMRRSCATEERRLALLVLIGEIGCGPTLRDTVKIVCHRL